MSAINLFSTNIFRDEVIHKVANLAINTSVKQRLSDYNLNISNVTWEDTSRYKNSCVGSNISDLTLKVENNRMPIIRSNNFTVRKNLFKTNTNSFFYNRYKHLL